MTRIRQVDAFTSEPFKGNPAGVCILDGPAEDQWMQSVAAEMNLAETAFLYPEGEDFNLRWFTPTTEVDLCGHATLASAHVLWEGGELERGQQAVFSTKSGVLTADRDGDWIVLDFPTEGPVGETPISPIETAIGEDVTEACRNRFDFLALVESAQVLRELKPDFRTIEGLGCRGLIVTAESDDPQYDFVSRFFAPAVGIDEDPVTGSAHCFLCPYWTSRLGKHTLTGYQASARGGAVGVELHGDRVKLKGQAITVLDGTLFD